MSIDHNTMSYIKKVQGEPRLHVSVNGRHRARLHRHRCRRRRAYAPTSNTASHGNHEKINSWVSFSFLYGYGAPLGGPWGRRSSAITISSNDNANPNPNSKPKPEKSNCRRYEERCQMYKHDIRFRDKKIDLDQTIA